MTCRRRARPADLTDEQQVEAGKGPGEQLATARKPLDAGRQKGRASTRKRTAAADTDETPRQRLAQRPTRDKSLPGSCRRPERAGRLKGLRLMEDFYRIRRLPPYVFEEVNRAKARARNRGRRHHRSRHGQSGFAGARACHREAQGDARQAAHRPLFGLARHSRAAPRAGGLLRAPLRGEAQSRYADRRDAGLQGRLRQRGAGDHRARRRRAGAQSELSDPRLRLSDGGRRDPLGAL